MAFEGGGEVLEGVGLGRREKETKWRFGIRKEKTMKLDDKKDECELEAERGVPRVTICAEPSRYRGMAWMVVRSIGEQRVCSVLCRWTGGHMEHRASRTRSMVGMDNVPIGGRACSALREWVDKTYGASRIARSRCTVGMNVRVVGVCSRRRRHGT